MFLLVKEKTDMDNRNVGRMAETELEKWSHQVGITPNRVTHDSEGWDYFMQFPFEIDTLTPTLDQRASRIECFVQVKGTDTAKKRKSISLSNWERLIRNPLPAFFLIVNYNFNKQPSSAYLIHVGKKWIEAVLGRLRKLDLNDAQNLNSKTLDVTWTEREKLDSLDGEGLRKAVLAHVKREWMSIVKKK